MMRIPQFALKAAATCLALAAALAACKDDGGTSPQTGPALRILAGAGITDTIEAIPTQGLVVQVLGEDGRPDAGVDVHFEVLPDPVAPFAPRILVANVGSSTFGTVAGATTDAEGRATVRIRLGGRAGPTGVIISVPLYSVVDTAEYTVLPGNAVRAALSPKDTALLLGDGFTYRGSTRDRVGNPRQDPATWEITGSAVSVDQSGRVTTLSMGIAGVRLRATIDGVEFVDSGTVSVIPQARIAYNSAQPSLSLIDLTGENMTTLVSSAGLAPAWHPDGTRVVYVRLGRGLFIVDLQGNVTELHTPGVSGATWPEYSSDGQWIYFHGTQAGFGNRIYRIRPSGADMQLIGPSQGSGEMPTPSPDGRRVAWVDGFRQLVIHDLATGTESVVPGTTNVYAPRWSPNGAWIAYTGHPGPLMLVRPDGSDLRQVGQHALRPGISWSPDSRWIIAMGNWSVVTDVTTGRSGVLNWQGEYPAWRP